VYWSRLPSHRSIFDMWAWGDRTSEELTNPLCRFCLSRGPQYTTQQHMTPSSYASTLVGDVWTTIGECEQQIIPSFTTWCMSCERVSFVCIDTVPDFYPHGVSVVHGPLTKKQTCVRETEFESQVVLLRHLQALSLCPES
jgi:hypothetical protein